MKKLDLESIWAWTKEHPTLVLTIIGLTALLFVFGWMFSSCGDWLAQRELKNLNKNINKANNELRNLNENLRNLEIDNRLQSENVNRLAENHNQAKNGSIEAQRETNDALENVNRVENGNFSNSTLDEANRNRCRAFPNAKGCQ